MFYESIIGDSPYSSFTVALIESDLPGGHSPGYFAALNQQLPSSGLVWRNDPAAFPNYPDFFLAHELAHQWWGQAVGWRNYHEQWISEGFAQYFAAMYAQHQRGDEGFASVLKQLRQWGMDAIRSGADLLSATGSGTFAAKAASSARWSTTRAPPCCTCCGAWSATTPFFSGMRRFYREVALPQGGHAGFPRGDGKGDRPLARAVLRSLDLRFDAAEAEGQPPRRGHRGRAARSSRSARSSTCRSR